MRTIDAIVIPSDPLASYVAKGEVKERYFDPANVFRRICVVQSEPGLPASFFGAAEVTEVLTSPARPDVERVRTAAPDAALVRGYGFDDAARGALAIARAMQVPAIVSAHVPPLTYARVHARHDAFLRRPLMLARVALWARTFRRSALVFAVSAFVADEVRRLAPRTRIEVLYNRVDRRFLRPPVVHDGRPLRVLTIGRLYPTKDHEVVLEAVARTPSAELVLVGQGPQEYALRDLARRLGIAKRVTWIRAVPYTELPMLYHDCDVFAISSEAEGFCNVVVEAMASGLPVVVADREPFREVTAGAALRVDPTPEAFAAALAGLAEPARRADLGARGYERAQQLVREWPEEREAAMILHAL